MWVLILILILIFRCNRLSTTTLKIVADNIGYQQRPSKLLLMIELILTMLVSLLMCFYFIFLFISNYPQDCC